MRKTVEYFLFPVEAVADLPAPVAALVEQAGFAPQTILVIPPQEYPIYHQYRFFALAYGERTTPRRTLVFGADRLLVIEQAAALRQIVIPYQAIVALDLAVVLLYAYITLTWQAAERRETLKIEYNAVGEALIRSGAQHIRRTYPLLESSAPDSTLTILGALPLKFRNYLRFSLLPDEQVFSAVFQPALEYPRRLLRTRLAGDRTIALTTAGITILETDASRAIQYGVTTRYFPLAALERVTFEPRADTFTWMDIGLPGYDVSLPLTAANAEAVAAALERFLPGVPVSRSAAPLVPAGIP